MVGGNIKAVGVQVLATLEELEEKKQALEERLFAGDASVEAALEQVDRAIAARSKQINYSRRRLDAARDAVKAGMSPEEARKKQSGSGRAKKKLANKPVNRF